MERADGESMKNLFDKKNIAYLYLAIMVLVCALFGANRLFATSGFPAIVAVFGISIVLSVLLRKPLSEVKEQEDDDEEDA